MKKDEEKVNDDENKQAQPSDQKNQNQPSPDAVQAEKILIANIERFLVRVRMVA